MNNDIKEILDRAKNIKNKCSCCEQISDNVYVSKYHEIQTQNLAEAVYIIDKLLDYITNLQEENKTLKQNQSGFTLEDYTRILNNYQELQKKYEETDNDRHTLFEQKAKAIEYIKTHYLKPNEPDLLSILQGEINE